jgi:CheY-like chemotaxis protein
MLQIKLVNSTQNFIELAIMSNPSFPFAVRLIGFSSQEADVFAATFAIEQGKGYGYVPLEEDNLRDPDLYLVNADELRALVTLSDLPPSDVRPVLLVGSPGIELPYARIEKPIRWHKMFEALDSLIEKRADALSRLEASDVVAVPERRRRERLDIDLTDPSVYQRMRGKAPADGGVLIVDKNPAFRAYLAELLGRYNMPVAWVSEEAKAADLASQQGFAVVMVNTSTPGVDPYRLCRAIKDVTSVEKTTVIFLVSKPFVYDAVQARAAGSEGFLSKPLASHHLIAVLKKFLPALSR